MRKLFLTATLFFGFVFFGMHAAGAADALAQDAFSNPGDMGAVTSGGGLKPVADKVDAGSVGLGSSSQVIVRFNNGDGQEVQFKDIRLFPSSNVAVEISSDACTPEPLPSGAECAVVLGLKGVQRGPFRVELLVSHTGRTRLVTATVNGSVDADDKAGALQGTDIQIDPTPIDFGSLEASRSLVRSVTLRNVTSQTLDITALKIDAPEQSGFALRSDCKSLMAGQACIASIVWQPRVQGPSSGFLVVEHTGPSRLSTAAITGGFKPTEAEAAKIFPSAIPGKGLLVSSETSVDFGTVSAESSITVSLVNTGDAPLTLKALNMANRQQGVKIEETGCKPDLVLEPTDACPLTLTWAPMRDGNVLDDIRISHTGARGILVIPVRGTSSAVSSIDQRPMVVVSGDGAAAPSTNGGAVGNTTASVATSASMDRAKLLENYKITSLAQDKAVLAGPGGSRIIRNGGSIRLAGELWQATIKTDGVMLKSGGTSVMLVFDRSFTPDTGTIQGVSVPAANNNGSTTGSSPKLEAAATSPPASATTTANPAIQPTPTAAPADAGAGQ